jgi:ketosteroid isomerase-like protein
MWRSYGTALMPYAINRGDLDGFRARLSPDVEWETGGEADIREVYRARAEARPLVELAVERWESFHVEVQEIIDASDYRVFVGLLPTARGKRGRVPTEQHGWPVVWFADGRIARRQFFWTRDQALEAGGLRD